MIIELKYNDILINFDLDINNKIGSIQEKILNSCTLLIYNIEYTEIIFDNNSYIFGSDDMLFDEIFQNFMDKNNYEEKNIDKLIVYDRKRDILRNVVKINQVIDKYNEWYTNNEETNYNNHIIRFPIERILQNILRIPTFTNEETITNEPTDNQIFTETEELPSEEILNETSEQQSVQRLYSNETEERLLSEEILNQTSGQQSAQRLYANEGLNNIINIFDRIITDNSRYYTIPSYQIFSFDNEFDDLPQLIDNDEFGYININNNFEDIKIVIEEEIFEKLDHILYENGDNDVAECLICIQELEKNIEITTLCCNHFFHKKCIKTWLCEESNKCPICRIDIEKGIPK